MQYFELNKSKTFTKLSSQIYICAGLLIIGTQRQNGSRDYLDLYNNNIEVSSYVNWFIELTLKIES